MNEGGWSYTPVMVISGDDVFRGTVGELLAEAPTLRLITTAVSWTGGAAPVHLDDRLLIILDGHDSHAVLNDLHQIAVTAPAVPVMVIAGDGWDDAGVVAAMGAGAAGVHHRPELTSTSLAKAVHDARAGDLALGLRATAAVMRSLRQHGEGDARFTRALTSLTRRERQVFNLMATPGVTNADIAGGSFIGGRADA